MSIESAQFGQPLPLESEAAVGIIRRLRDAGHEALLNGGCVRDLLLGITPKDYDVATDAPPERVRELFRATRAVGAQFGVVLVRRRGVWVEVATFRRDWDYADGRRPTGVTFCNARQDAQRRDFTINGMFLDPLGMRLIDHVDGRADLDAGLIRAIGEPAERFAEDYLRLLRAVRFAARLDFRIEERTLAAIREHARLLPRVAAERRRDELEKMLAHPARGRAFELLEAAGLLGNLWPGATWERDEVESAARVLARMPAEATFESALALMLAERSRAEIAAICRELTCSNQQRETILWLVDNQAALDDPERISPADLKRLMAGPAFAQLRTLFELRLGETAAGAARGARLAGRVDAIAPDAIAPPPLVTGDDLAARGVAPGPIYRRVLDALYARQLNEELVTREAALQALETLLANAVE